METEPNEYTQVPCSRAGSIAPKTGPAENPAGSEFPNTLRPRCRGDRKVQNT